MKVQIAIAYAEAKKLAEDHILKLIRCQAKKLTLSDWEITFLQETCTRKHCVDKGFGAVYEFAGYIDRIDNLLARKKEVIVSLSSLYKCYRNRYFDAEVFISTLIRLAEINAKLIHVICLWRKLNWNPRPIFNDPDSSNPLYNVFPNGVFGERRASLFTVIREEAYDLLEFVQENDIDLASINGIHPVLAILLAPVMDDLEFSSYLKFSSQGNLVTSRSILDLFRSIRNMYLHEDRIEKVWHNFAVGQDRHGNPVELWEDVINRYPILRIPYPDIVCVCPSLRWFSKVQSDYKACLVSVATEIKNCSFEQRGSFRSTQRLVQLPLFRSDDEVSCRLPAQPNAVREQQWGDAIDVAKSDDDVVDNQKGISPQTSEELHSQGVLQRVVMRRGVSNKSKIESPDPVRFVTTPASAKSYKFPSSAINNEDRHFSASDIRIDSSESTPEVRDLQSSGMVSSTLSGLSPARQTSSANVASKSYDRNSPFASSRTVSKPGNEALNNVSAPTDLSMHLFNNSEATPESPSINRTVLENGRYDDGAQNLIPHEWKSDLKDSPETKLSAPAASLSTRPEATPSMPPREESANNVPIDSPGVTTTIPIESSPAAGVLAAPFDQDPTVGSNTQLRPEQLAFLHSQQLAQLEFQKQFGYSPFATNVKPRQSRSIDRPRAQSAGGRSRSSHHIHSSSTQDLGAEFDFEASLNDFDVVESDGILQRTPEFPGSNRSSGVSSRNSSMTRKVSPQPSEGSRPRSASAISLPSGSSRTFLPSRPRSGSKRYSNKHMETLDILQSLTTSNLRGEALMDSQLVKLAFKQVDNLGGTIVMLAARKIQFWWKFIFPRKRLLRRLAAKEVIQTWIFDLADEVVAKCIINKRRRIKLLKAGSALKIQKKFRKYRAWKKEQEIKAEIAQRKLQTNQNISKWVKTTWLLVLIYRYIKSFHRKLNRRAAMLKLPKKKIVSFSYFGEALLVKLREGRLRAALNFINQNSAQSVTLIKSQNQRRVQVVKEREHAAVKVQSLARNILARGSKKRREYEREMMHRIKSFLYYVVYLYRRKRMRIQKKAVISLQRIVRGFLRRNEMERIVKAGLLLNSSWRKYKAKKMLRQNLRRVERPARIVLHGLRHVSQQLLHSQNVRVKISVWWHPLLHIVSEADFATIISHKQPQFVWYSKFYSPQQEVDRTEVREEPAPTSNRLTAIMSGLFTGSQPPARPSIARVDSALKLVVKLKERRKSKMLAAGKVLPDDANSTGSFNIGSANALPVTGTELNPTLTKAATSEESDLLPSPDIPAPPKSPASSPPKKRFNTLANRMLMASKDSVQTSIDGSLDNQNIAAEGSTGSSKSLSAGVPNFLSGDLVKSSQVGERSRGGSEDSIEHNIGTQTKEISDQILVSLNNSLLGKPISPMPQIDASANSLPSASRSPLAKGTRPSIAVVAKPNVRQLTPIPMRPVNALVDKSNGSLSPASPLFPKQMDASDENAGGTGVLTPSAIIAESKIGPSLASSSRSRPSFTNASRPVGRHLTPVPGQSRGQMSALHEGGSPFSNQESGTSAGVGDDSVDHGRKRITTKINIGDDERLHALVADVQLEAVLPRRQNSIRKSKPRTSILSQIFSHAPQYRKPSMVKEGDNESDDDNDSEEDDDDDDDNDNDNDGADHENEVNDRSGDNSNENIAAGTNAPVGTISAIVRTARTTILGGRNGNVSDAPSSAGNDPHQRRTTLRDSNGRRKSSATAIGSTILRRVTQTINRISGAAPVQVHQRGRKNSTSTPKMFCHFDDEVCRIPGCHGNSVFKFDFQAGERTFGTHLFFMSREDGILFWGGEYTKDVVISQARRHAQMKNKVLRTGSAAKVDGQQPIFEFKLVSGAPLKARSQWARIMVKGSGLKSIQHSLPRTSFLSNFGFLSSWHKIYLCLDDDGLSIYDSKSSPGPLVFIPNHQVVTFTLEQGTSTRNARAGAFTEDIVNVMITLRNKDEIYFRFSDVAARVGLVYSFENCLSSLRASSGVGDTSKTSSSTSLSLSRTVVEAFKARIRLLMKKGPDLSIANADAVVRGPSPEVESALETSTASVGGDQPVKKNSLLSVLSSAVAPINVASSAVYAVRSSLRDSIRAAAASIPGFVIPRPDVGGDEDSNSSADGDELPPPSRSSGLGTVGSLYETKISDSRKGSALHSVKEIPENSDSDGSDDK